MAIEEGANFFHAETMDGGLNTRLPAHRLGEDESPDAQNFDPSFVGGLKKRKGFIKFTGSAKGSPTGGFVSGLFAAATQGSPASKVWSVDDDGGPGFTDRTDEFNDTVKANCPAFPVSEAVDDYFAIGYTATFPGLTIALDTGVGVGGTVTWEYYNGSSWASLSNVTDNTTGLTATGENAVKFTIPADWATLSLNGSAALYWVRAKVTGVYSTNPNIDYGWVQAPSAKVLAAEGTALHDISDGTWGSAISSTAIVADSPVEMDMYNDKFLICNKGGGPWKYQIGNTPSGGVASLGGSPPANAVNVMVHRSRVFFYPENSSTVTFSALNAEEDYTTADNAGTLTINKGDGMHLNGMISAADYAVFSKIAPSSGGTEGRLYALFGSSPFDYSVIKIADIAAYSQSAMMVYDQIVFVATDRGLFGIRGREAPFKVSDRIQPSIEAIPNPDTFAIGRYRSKIKFAYPSSGTENDEQFVLDVERGVWGKDTGKSARRFVNHPDGRLLFGSSTSSIVVYEDENGTNDDSSAINFYWETPDLTFGSSFHPKRPRNMFMHAKNTGNFIVTMTATEEGTDNNYSDTMNVSTEGPVKRMKHFGGPVGNRPRKMRAKMTNNTADQDITIYELLVSAQGYDLTAK